MSPRSRAQTRGERAQPAKALGRERASCKDRSGGGTVPEAPREQVWPPSLLGSISPGTCGEGLTPQSCEMGPPGPSGPGRFQQVSGSDNEAC